MEEPESLNVLKILPELIGSGVSALKIEGRQRTKTYVAAMTKVLKEALQSYYRDPSSYTVRPEWSEKTVATFEGAKETVGPYVIK